MYYCATKAKSATKMYSIAQILHPHKDKNGKQKVQIRIIYNRARVYLKTNFKVFPGAENVKINAIVKRQMSEAEDKMLDAIRDGLTTHDFKTLFKKEKARSIRLVDYIETLTDKLKGKLSQGTLAHYTSLGKKVGSVMLSEINVKWLENFDSGLTLDSNSINANMKRFKSILFKAAADGFIKEDQFKKYKVPAYKQKLVEYLTEKEIDSFTKIVRAVNVHSKKIAGWYFLLSCYTGWRISDVKRFNKGLITGNKIIIRAKKNGEIIPTPIHSRLKEVLNFVAKNPFDISEQQAREFVKELAGLAGIKKHVKFHSARHSFAMLLMANGFTIDEVAYYLGDSVLIAKVYARVHNESLDKKIREKLG